MATRKPKLPELNIELEALMRDSAASRRGRRPGTAPPKTNRQAVADFTTRVAEEGGRVVSIGWRAPAAAALDKLKAELGLLTDRAAAEVAVLFAAKPTNMAALRKILGRK